MDVASHYFPGFIFREEAIFWKSTFTFDTEVPFIYFARTI